MTPVYLIYYLYILDCPMINWRPVQGVTCIFPSGSWEWLQRPCDPLVSPCFQHHFMTSTFCRVTLYSHCALKGLSACCKLALHPTGPFKLFVIRTVFFLKQKVAFRFEKLM